MLRSTGPCLILLCSCLVLADAAEAQHLFIEDFTTTTYRDAANTTADWNTAAGRLQLYPHLEPIIGSAPGAADSWDVAVWGELLLVADGVNGLALYKISNPGCAPHLPCLLSTLNTPVSVHDLAVDGDLVYLADGPTGMIIVDITDPAAPVQRGTYDSPGAVRGFAPAGRIVWLADDSAGVKAVDVSDPDLPVLVGAVDPPGIARNVALAGDYLYVANGPSGLRVIDVSDPTAPVDAASFATGGDCTDVVVAGNLVYLSCRSNGLRIVDVSDPTAPVLAGQLFTGNLAVGLALDGDHLYVALDAGGLLVVDVTEPGFLALDGQVAMPGPASGVALAGEYGFVAAKSGGVQVVQAGYRVAVNPRPALALPAVGEELASDGDLLVIAAGSAGILTYDISEPAAPVPLGGFDTPGDSRGVALDGDLLHVADGSQAFRVLDVSDPANPALLGELVTGGVAQDLVAVGDHVYLADGDGGLQVIDVSDPAAPFISGTYDPAGAVVSVGVAGRHAYLGANPGGMQVVDIADPSAPILVGSFAVSIPTDLLVYGDNTVGTNLSSLVSVLDITLPTAPDWRSGTILSGNQLTDMTLAGEILYIADGYGAGVRVLSLRDLDGPVGFSSYAEPGSGVAILATGDHLYLTTAGADLRVMDIMQRERNVLDKRAQSLPVDTGDYVIHRVRLGGSPAPGDYSGWYSVDAGTWRSVSLNGDWVAVPDSNGTDLRWRIDMSYTREEPYLTELTMEWLDDRPTISSIEDIPADQGGQVRLAWTRSGRDFGGAPEQITGYAVYRRFAAAGKAAVRSATPPTAAGRAHAAAMLGAGWDYLVTLPARQEDQYAYVASTLADSSAAGGTAWSAFRVTALTAATGIFYDSPVDSGYSVDNLVPNVPANIAAAYSASGVQLDWDDAQDADFRYFRVYRDVTPGFAPAPGNLVHETIASGWIDPLTAPWGRYYKITALDFAGNESGAGVPLDVSGVGDDALRMKTGLGAAVPNPFNPATVLSFDLAVAGRVTLTIHDMAGRRVRVLLDERRNAGRHRATWDGRDGAGHPLAAGVYLYRLETPGFMGARRVVLVK